MPPSEPADLAASGPTVPRRVVLVTGASKGIGLATGIRFLQAGFTTVVCARPSPALDAVRAAWPEMDVVPCDMAEKADVERLAAYVTERYGVLEVLVNNVGVFLPGSLLDEPDEAFERMMHTNLFGTYYLTKRLAPAMAARGTGTIVHVCSIASVAAHPHGGSYAASKHALLGHARGLRQELKPHGVRVVAVLPGATLTDSWAGTDVPEDRFIPAEDVADVIFDACTMSRRTVVEEIVLRPLAGDVG